MRTYKILASMIALILLLGGCCNLSSTQQRVLSGGAIGAGTGAAIAAIAGGGVLAGTAIGAGAGAIGGFIYDEVQKKNR
jgi:osmotically inducible lipoprotein OsmB